MCKEEEQEAWTESRERERVEVKVEDITIVEDGVFEDERAAERGGCVLSPFKMLSKVKGKIV